MLTGGPGTGKSTLLAELARREIATVPEVARAILQSPGGMKMRADHPATFARAMYLGELKAFEDAGRRGGLTVFDRGFADSAAFLELEGCKPLTELENAGRKCRYEGPVFRAPPWREIYHTDAERNQDWDQVIASDAAIAAVWEQYGYQLIDLPLLPVRERADWLLAQLAAD